MLEVAGVARGVRAVGDSCWRGINHRTHAGPGGQGGEECARSGKPNTSQEGGHYMEKKKDYMERGIPVAVTPD